MPAFSCPMHVKPITVSWTCVASRERHAHAARPTSGLLGRTATPSWTATRTDKAVSCADHVTHVLLVLLSTVVEMVVVLVLAMLLSPWTSIWRSGRGVSARARAKAQPPQASRARGGGGGSTWISAKVVHPTLLGVRERLVRLLHASAVAVRHA